MFTKPGRSLLVVPCIFFTPWWAVAPSKSIIDVNHLDDVFHQPRRIFLASLLKHVVHEVTLVPLLGWPEIWIDVQTWSGKIAFWNVRLG